MEDIGIGRLIHTVRYRDAVHIAVIPVIAAEVLSPGQQVALTGDKQARDLRARERLAGVVDPYLTRNVEPGEKFYLFLPPGSITSLRHYWTHPDFPDESLTVDDHRLAQAKAIVTAEADHAGISYAEIMDAARAYIEDDQYLSQGGRWEGHDMLDQDAFWQAYAAITGQRLPEGSYGRFFSCAC